MISVAVSTSVVLGLAAANRYSFQRLILADLAIAFVAATGARFRLRLSPECCVAGSERPGRCGTGGPGMLAVLPAFRVHHWRQGSRRIRQRGDPNRSTRDSRPQGSSRRVSAAICARLVFSFVPAPRLLQPALHGFLPGEPRDRRDCRAVSAFLSGVDCDRLRPRWPHRRTASGRCLGHPRRAGGVLRGPPARGHGSGLRGRQPPDAQRRRSLVFSLSEYGTRDAGGALCCAAGERTRARRSRCVLRAGLGRLSQPAVVFAF